MSCQPLRGGNAVITRGCVPRAVQPPPPETEPFESDAIMRPRLLYLQSYDTGVHQSIGVSTGRRETLSSGALTWSVQPTGGRRNGGYARSVANVNPTGGQYSIIYRFENAAFGEPEEQVQQGGMSIAFNLFGQTLSAPMNCLALCALAPPFAATPSPQVLVRIMPDRTVQIGTMPFGVFTLLDESTFSVPENGWFALEPQVGVSPFNNDVGGFALVQFYSDDTPETGLAACRAVGVKTRTHGSTDTLSAFAWGTEVIPSNGPGLSGIGVDDIHLYGPYGQTKRFISNAYIGAAYPTANGDTVESTTFYDGTHTTNTTFPEVIPFQTTFGVADRPQNLQGVGQPQDTRQGEDLTDGFLVGTISIFTGIWLTGPFIPPPDLLLPRNVFIDGAMDLYRMAVIRPNIAAVEGVQPFWLFGVRTYGASVTALGVVDSWNLLAPTRTADAGSGSTNNHRAQAVLSLGGTLAFGREANASGIDWKPIEAYTRNPWNVFDRDPNGEVWTPDTLRAAQAGVRGELGALSEEDPEDQWIEFDIIQFGHEYSYHTAIINEIEHAPFPPVAALKANTDEVNLFRLFAADHSVDWDGTIVSRVIDWGDGSPTEDLPANPLLDPGSGLTYSGLTHDYAPGTYTVTLTVTDSDGLTDVVTQEFVVANTDPTANFDYAANPDDVTFMTIDFEDQSVDVDIDDEITAWDWDFGDGDPHGTTQNPTHEYDTPGTYTVVLTVTDANGGTDNVSRDVDVPLTPPVSDCGLSADAQADLAYVQGDDFDGGNPPLPAYANRASFRDYYWLGSPFREWYDSGYASIDDTTEYDLDAGTPFHGHSTLKMGWGRPGGTTYHGAGWDSVPTDDGDPTETYYSNSPHFGPLTLWHRQIFKAEAGVMSQVAPALGATNYFEGLAVFECDSGDAFFGVYNRNGHLYLDIDSREVDGGAHVVSSTDLGLESSFIGRGDSLFGELGWLYEADVPGKSMRLRVWIGDACELTGVSPVADVTKPVHKSPSGTPSMGVGYVGHYNNIFATPVAAPLKYLWHAQAEMEPATVSANPYDYSLT